MAGTAGGPDIALTRRVIMRCREVLEANWHEGVRDGVTYAYTSPSSNRYPWQWYWDSGFIAIVNRHFHPDRAKQELESLLAAADDNGFIGHTIFWGTPVSRTRSLFYNLGPPKRFSFRRPNDKMTASMQPPLLAWAWKIAVGDPAQDQRIVKHHARLMAERDLEGNGLLWIVQPDESGLDSSPAFDRVWGRRAHGKWGFRRLVIRNRKLRYSARAIAAAGGPVVCEPLTNTLHGLSELALGHQSITPELVAKLYDKEKKIFRVVAQPKDVPTVLTIGGLAPLALPDLPDKIAREMIEEHLLNPKKFLIDLQKYPAGVAPPSVALSEKSFTLRENFFGLRRYWRGPTWVNTAWLVWMGMQRLGYVKEATELAQGIAEAVDKHGLREFYDPFTGKGMGGKDFGWSALIADMLVNDAGAKNSYLPMSGSSAHAQPASLCG